jgi:hypothetical protein
MQASAVKVMKGEDERREKERERETLRGGSCTRMLTLID